jgi:hypothetical protein
LATIAAHFISNTQATLGKVVGGLPAPQAAKNVIVGQAAFTDGGTHAFLVGAFMIWTASLLLWVFLNVSHEEMATDGPGAPAAH